MKIPFDIKYRPQIESGEYKVETRNGKSVRIICWDKQGECPIVVVSCVDGDDGVYTYHENGCYDNYESIYDLFIITPEEEMTEFEKAVGLAFVDAQLIPRDKDGIANIHDIDEFIKKKAAELLAIAKKEFKNNVEADYKELLHERYEQGKTEALKDLPRWRKWENGAAGNSAGHPIALVSGAGGIRFASVLGAIGEKYIMLDDLEKLPGFDNN